MKRTSGFTLAEIMVVVSILTIVIGATTLSFREILQRSRDDRRIADMQQVDIALELHRRQDPNNEYPEESGADSCGDGYDRSRDDGEFLVELINHDLMEKQAIDPTNSGACGDEYTYKYQRFNEGEIGNCTGHGGFYILGITDLEQVDAGDSHISSPGFSCGNITDWHTQGFEWVTGGYDGQ